MLPRIIEAKYVAEKVVWLRFADGAEGGPNPMRHRDHALAVRPDDADAGLLGSLDQLRFVAGPRIARLTESRREYDGVRDAGPAAVPHGRRDGCHGHGNDGEIARFRHGVGVGIAALPVQLGILRIDEVNRLLEARRPETRGSIRE